MINPTIAQTPNPMIAKMITANSFHPDKPAPLFSSDICSENRNSKSHIIVTLKCC